MASAQLQNLTDKILELPLGTAVKQFLDYLTIEAGLSGNTVLGYGRDLKNFVRYSKSAELSTLSDIQPRHIYAYMKSLTVANRAEASINRALVALKMLLRYGKLTGLTQNDFTILLEGPKLWQRLPVICSKAQVMKLLEGPDSQEKFYLRDRAMLELLYATGARASEIANLKISDLNLKIGYTRCLGKGNKERIIPLSRAAIEAVAQYITEQRPNLAKSYSGDFLLLSRTGRALGRIEIWRLVKKYAVRAGMPKNLTVHTLRHCFATHLLCGGADLRSVQEMLGHVDVATTQIYTHVDQDRLRSMHKKFHPRP
ncbi:MAG: tyrosine recombinase [Planctomycetes bacterium]|nr:tyrosine recombinase [Planctomycetota bacterium]